MIRDPVRPSCRSSSITAVLGHPEAHTTGGQRFPKRLSASASAEGGPRMTQLGMTIRVGEELTAAPQLAAARPQQLRNLPHRRGTC
jgi:hypothetical protein